ncbi:hypothetical protein BJ138DRAFT_906417 [Hygrophoropsis aurantiaca]|uniref:Uncharacterized protein n=1 Tax=Hygrophoropsis aurantiaca TaxID=72124 RepID=A0ACB8AE18_9AGAM|nr:hypothetical protein BJ138DRAFT_906417 [Hygrophoropsis aurantiaca]
MSLAKLPFIFSSAWSMHKTFTPPNVPPSADEQAPSDVGEDLLRTFTVWGTIVMKSACWAVALSEAGALLSPYVSMPPSAPLAAQVGMLRQLNAPTPVTPAFVIGSALMTASGLLRWFCYRTLGRFFTFQLSVRKAHALVTDGPYSVVRHPSYTGALLGFIGVCMVHGSRTSWLRTSGVLDLTGVKALGVSAFSIYSLTVVCLGLRIPREDEMLHKRFRGEWEDWAHQVRYRLIPGIW